MFDVRVCQDLALYCLPTHPVEVDALLAKTKYISGLSEACINRSNVEKRSAGRGSKGRSRSRGSSSIRRVASAGSTLLRGRSKSKGLSRTGRKSSLRKYGKYAVAGLAGKCDCYSLKSNQSTYIASPLAYGAYKVGKKMSKGLRGHYDDDDCWDYSALTGQYRCVCSQDCQVYVGGGASAMAATGIVVATSLAVSLLLRRDGAYL